MYIKVSLRLISTSDRSISSPLDSILMSLSLFARPMTDVVIIVIVTLLTGRFDKIC